MTGSWTVVLSSVRFRAFKGISDLLGIRLCRVVRLGKVCRTGLGLLAIEAEHLPTKAGRIIASAIRDLKDTV